jgi:predicted nucleotidyltransferase
MVQAKSSNLSGAIYLDKAGRIKALCRAAIRARKRVPAIRRAILFGSLASGNATPRYDADILVIVENSLYSVSRDRIPEMLQAFSPLPCPIDLYVLTRDEFERYRSAGSPLLRAAMDESICLL